LNQWKNHLANNPHHIDYPNLQLYLLQPYLIQGNLNKFHNLFNLFKHLHNLAYQPLSNSDDDMNTKKQWSCQKPMAQLQGLCPD
jgi:hypothetical protein